jgi:peptidyl-tRNA hydrolase
MDPAEYVLNAFNVLEQPCLERALDQAAETFQVMFVGGLQTAMNRFQKKIRTEEG